MTRKLPARSNSDANTTGAPTSPGTIPLAPARAHTRPETHGDPGSGGPPQAPGEVQTMLDTHRGHDLAGLRLMAEMFWDLMKFRIATASRIGGGSIDSEAALDLLAALEHQEKALAKALVAEYRLVAPPEVLAWQRSTIGIGEHTMARLLGHLGHPVHARPLEWVGTGAKRKLVATEPFDRGVGQLWAYCGVGDPSRKRHRGMTADDALAGGNPHLRTILYVIADGCVKQRRSPYRATYDAARETYEQREWTKGHRHAAAMRKVGKEILRDLWVASGDAPASYLPKPTPPAPGRLDSRMAA